ncbi:MAG: pyruvate ferredoxin oxidoreductase delta subunit [Clostridia bacterium]|nr:pyruvate ferredoxin oxidoreductase delta subunit [Clostridia bacterium]
MAAKDLPLVPGARPGSMAAAAAMERIREQRPAIDKEKCNLCRECLLYCPDAALAIAGGEVRLELRFCKGCGICARECPARAITMVPEYAGDRGLVGEE